ncbi:MAG: hypothetical protein ABI865_06525 [Nitrosospira sp.]
MIRRVPRLHLEQLRFAGVLVQIDDARGDRQVVVHPAAAKEDAAISELEHMRVERQALLDKSKRRLRKIRRSIDKISR